MGKKFFDDTAFFFVVVSVLFVILVPWTLSKFYGYFKSEEGTCRDPTNEYCMCEHCALKSKTSKPTVAKGIKSKFSFCNILFLLLWILLIVLSAQLPDMQDAELATFEPFTILGIEKDATDGEIKKAYRKMSKIHHPDVNRDDPEADQKFMMIAKAYNTLTDEVAKANYAKFGNPDGFQGASLTFGLPSFLTDERNELPVLFLYFLFLVVIPPIGVWIWWSGAKKNTATGVQRQTLIRQYKLINESTTANSLMEVLALSAEYEVLGTTATKRKDLAELEKKVKDKYCKFKTKDVLKRLWSQKSIVLLYAHLLRIKIPASLQADYAAICTDAPRILATMLDGCVQRTMTVPGFATAVLSVAQLVQCMTQKLWFRTDPLLQLPHLDEDDLKYLAKKRIKTLSQFKKLTQEEKEDAIHRLSPDEWKEVNAAAARIPTIDMDAKAYVEDEEGICEGDIITVAVDLFRLNAEELRSGVRGERHLKSKAVTAARDKLERNKKLDSLDADDLILELPVPKKKSAANVVTYAYAPLYPYPKAERWFVYLTKGKRVISFQKLIEFQDTGRAVFMMRAPPKGTHEFTVHAICDSYMGCSKSVDVTMKVQSLLELKDKKEEDEFVEEEELEEEEEEEGEYSPIWDYIVLVLLMIFAYNWLQSKGYWTQYFTPVINKAVKLAEPITDQVYPVIKPVWDPMVENLILGVDWLANVLHNEIPEGQ